MRSPAVSRVKVAVGQMTSTANKAQNLQICSQLVSEAAASGATFLALPECFNFIGGHWSETVKAAEPLNGPSMTAYRNLAKESGLWLSLGGFQEKVNGAGGGAGVAAQHVPREDAEESSRPSAGKVYNTHVIISAAGEIEAAYRKIHLFDVDVPGASVMLESRYTEAGRDVVVCRDTPAGDIGLSTCYDVRFPEMYTCLAAGGAEVMLVPSAFTVPTGTAHWEVLLRARAIENQAYVIASAQVGQHNHKRRSYGHSLIVDPWGKVLADAGGVESPCIRVAEIDFAELGSIRDRMPVAAHRRAAGPIFEQQRWGESSLLGKPSSL